MAPANGSERAAIGAGAGVVTFDPVFATFKRASAGDIARHGCDPLDEAERGLARPLQQCHIPRTRTITGEGEAIEEDTLAGQDRRGHAAAVDADAPGGGENEESVKARNDRNQTQEAAKGLSRHIRL